MQHMVVLRGPIGAGKSSLMYEVQKRLPESSVVEVDALKRMVDPSESSEWRRNIAIDAGAFLASQLLQSGRSVVAETHARWGYQNERFQAVASAITDVMFRSFLVWAPYETCLARVSQRQNPGMSYAIDEQMVRDYYTNLEPLPNEPLINTASISTAEAAEIVLQNL